MSLKLTLFYTAVMKMNNRNLRTNVTGRNVIGMNCMGQKVGNEVYGYTVFIDKIKKIFYK
jgi:hypothetical protein